MSFSVMSVDKHPSHRPVVAFGGRGAAGTPRLICLPYAGGSAMGFRSFRELFPKWLDVCLLELPGRGTRIHEALETDMGRLVQSIATELVSLCTESPFVLYGHSMGALIAYRLAKELRISHGLEVGMLLVSGAKAPHFPRGKELIHEMSDEQLIARLHKMDGAGTDLYRDRELGGLMLEVLRSDFRMLETSSLCSVDPLPCPVHAFGGDQDPFVDHEGVEGWRLHTESRFKATFYPGGHFFIREYAREMVSDIMKDLNKLFAC